ncbi:hypothetical protein BGZ83_003054, partial [Gryganskiella cystojenkinii]
MPIAFQEPIDESDDENEPTKPAVQDREAPRPVTVDVMDEMLAAENFSFYVQSLSNLLTTMDGN